MSKYAGITIGPIFDTIGNASSPVALWFASSIFSDITRRLCEKISAGFDEGTILSPYYSENIDLSDSIGKFHDRIVFWAPEITADRLGGITDEVKEEIIEDFPAEFHEDRYVTFLKTYLQIHYCILSEEEVGDGNPVLVLSPYLDALELMKTFVPTDTDNPFSAMFRADREGPNARIRKSSLFGRINQRNQFKNRDENIRSIEEIAEGRYAVAGYKALKMSHYFAVVSADGDGMGKYLSRLHSSDEITKFSKACLTYSKEAARMIGRYGGMTIYAGGDDLLFLAPLIGAAEEGTERKNIFALCGEINRKFHEIISSENEGTSVIPTISFGISIQYKKFPLYEARANASHLLFDVAKKNDGTKNSMAVNLQKHSGQSVALRISNNRQDMFQEFLHVGKGSESDTAGAMRTIAEFREVLKVLDDRAQSEEQFMDAWRNFYDNAGQKPAESFSSEIGRLYYRNFVAGRQKLQGEIEIPDGSRDTGINQLLAILSIRRFAQEEEDEGK